MTGEGERRMIDTLNNSLAVQERMAQILEGLPPSMKAVLALLAIGVFFLFLNFLITLILLTAILRKTPTAQRIPTPPPMRKPPTQTTLILIVETAPTQSKGGGDSG